MSQYLIIFWLLDKQLSPGAPFPGSPGKECVVFHIKMLNNCKIKYSVLIEPKSSPIIVLFFVFSSCLVWLKWPAVTLSTSDLFNFPSISYGQRPLSGDLVQPKIHYQLRHQRDRTKTYSQRTCIRSLSSTQTTLTLLLTLQGKSLFFLFLVCWRCVVQGKSLFFLFPVCWRRRVEEPSLHLTHGEWYVSLDFHTDRHE